MLRTLLSLGVLAATILPNAVIRADTGAGGEGTARRTVDDPDAGGACDCTHLIYFIPSDGIDDALDVDGTIAASARALRTWFAEQMQLVPRMDRIGTSEVYDITFVRGRSPGSSYVDLRTLTTELAGRGFDDPAKRYLVYAALDRGSTCGESTFGGPVLPGPTYAAVYLDSPDCNARSLGNLARGDALAAHEWLHAEGITPPTALHHCATSPHHVCTGAMHLLPAMLGIIDPERSDIMYPYVDARLSAKVLDRDRDDYLDHGIPGGQDLRTSIFLEAA